MNTTADNSKRYFTVEEANRRLPLVRAIVEDIVTLFHEVHDRKGRLLRIRQTSRGGSQNEQNLYEEELDQIERDLEKDVQRLDDFVQELRELGVELKDYANGLVDFPTLIDGREAYLCWKRGEDEIAYWHELDAGFQGRQSLFAKSASSDGSEGGKIN
jgi:hypothetical protein